MVGHIFTAELWDYEADQPGSWHFLTLPMGVADDLSADAGPRRGFGSIRVEARIGDTTWHTSLFPDSKSGSLFAARQEAGEVGRGHRTRVDLRGGAAPNPVLRGPAAPLWS